MYAGKFGMTVDECINQVFDGKVKEFKKEADWFISEGCGVAG